MSFIFTISMRNLIRQKKRNILLGISIAFGVMILVVANSFSHGISDVMMNRIMRYIAGQVSVTSFEQNKIACNVFRDKARVLDIIKKNGQGITRIDEALGVVSRVIGKGKAQNAMVAGLDTRQNASDKLLKEFKESFIIVDGSFESLRDSKAENPAVISSDWARELNVGVGDTIRARYRDIYGRNQAARLTVTGVMKITNIFMSGVIFVELQNARELCGYKPWEYGAFNFTLDHPKRDAVKVADRLHKALKPGIAQIAATVEFNGYKQPVSVFGFFNDNAVKNGLEKTMPVVAANEDKFGKKGVVLTLPLSYVLRASVGDKIRVSYRNKFEDKLVVNDLAVTAIVDNKGAFTDYGILLNENIFYSIYYEDLPKDIPSDGSVYIPKKEDKAYELLAPEWVLLPRTKTTDEFKKKLNKITSRKSKATLVDVSTMYEQASDILKFETAINLITLVAVLILFFIIIVGVVNTMRMTIRERTREIGTMRAIGMQMKDVRNSFILEMMLLTACASAAGILMAFGAMSFISSLTINIPDNPLGMFLVSGHIYFLPTLGGVVFNVILILVIASVTAYFPARRAAKLSAADALRHYE